MKLVENWRALPRMYSVQAMSAIVVIQAARVTVGADTLAMPVPLLGSTVAEALTALTAVLALTGIVGRAVAQFTEP